MRKKKLTRLDFTYAQCKRNLPCKKLEGKGQSRASAAKQWVLS